MVSRQILDEIRSKVDIVDFLEKRGTTFRPAGTALVALCPVHNERSPSFNVRPDIQRFNCFGCGVQGDIFSLVETLDGLTFFGAVEYLADELGIKIINEQEDEKYKKAKRLYEVCDITSALFRHNFLELPESHPAKQNLVARDLLDNAMHNKMIGYASNNGLLALLKKAGYTEEEAIEAGVAVKSDNSNAEATSKFNSMNQAETRDKFRNRLMWTLCDISGRPIGFSGRIIYESETNKAPKYLNSPATPLFIKSQVLLNLHAAKKEIVRKQEVIIVEGQTDVDAFVAAGILNVVATCGTAFGPSHANIINRLSNTGKEAEKFRFVFCFDGDSAGVKAAESVFTKIPEIQLNSYVASMTPKDEEGNVLFLDPCDVRVKFGDGVLLYLLEKQISLIEFILKQEQKKWNTATIEGRSGFVTAAKAHISHVKDPLQYDGYLRKIAFSSGVPYSQLNQLVPQNRSGRKTQDDGTPAKITVGNLEIEDRLIAFALQYPEETKEAFRQKNVNKTFFSDWVEPYDEPEPVEGEEIPEPPPVLMSSREKIVKAFAGELLETPLAYVDLQVQPSRVSTTIQHLLSNFLKVKFMEATSQLTAQLAAATSDDTTISDDSMLLEMLTKQQELRKLYSQ